MSKIREKIAQRMSTWQKVKEWGNVPRRVREWSSQNVYAPQMRQLRDVAGQVGMLEESEFPGVRESIKMARRSLINGYYPSAMYYSNQVSKFVWKMWQIISQISEIPEQAVGNFFLQHPGVSNQNLSKMHSEVAKASVDNELIKQADLRDLWDGAVELGWMAKNFFSKRRQERDVMERLYPEKARAMRSSSERIVMQAEGLYFDLKNSLREMGNAVASGDINTYLKIARKLYQRQQGFNEDFVNQYQQNFANLMGGLNDMDQPEETQPEQVVQEEPVTQHPEYIASEESNES